MSTKKKQETKIEKDTFTQFGYACKQLGIDIRTSSVPQAKGRVERMFGTLQSRLPVELRLENITSIEAANKFLKSYLKKFNKQFALPIDSIKSVFEKQPVNEKINLILLLKLTNFKFNIKQNDIYYSVKAPEVWCLSLTNIFKNA